MVPSISVKTLKYVEFTNLMICCLVNVVRIRTFFERSEECVAGRGYLRLHCRCNEE
jgi:hypothetical protein